MRGKNLKIENVRGTEQRERMNLAEDLKLCPFCDEGLTTIHKMPIEESTEHLFVTKNAFPYEGTKCHYLIISKEHITDVEDLTPTHWMEVRELFSWVVEKERLDSGALLLRFGSMNKTGSSVGHIHFQVISGAKSDEDDDAESLKVKIGYK